MVLRVPKETREFNAVTVTLDGTARTTGVELTVIPDDATTRPTNWIPPVVRGEKIGIMIENLEPGSYRVFARITDAGDQLVRSVGAFIVF